MNARRTNSNLVFDTPTFRRLLAKTRTAAAISTTQSAEYNPPKLFMQIGAEIPGVNSVVFPLTENETPRYSGRLFGLAVVADTEQADLAIEYVLFRMSKVTKATEVLLFDGAYEAIERDDFPAFVSSWKTELERLQAMLATEDNPIAQREMEAQIEKLKDQIEHPLDSLRYAITSEEIAFYQENVISSIEFIFSNPITESSITSLWAKQLIEQYTTGIITDEMFIRKLDERIWMMEMEADK